MRANTVFFILLLMLMLYAISCKVGSQRWAGGFGYDSLTDFSVDTVVYDSAIGGLGLTGTGQGGGGTGEGVIGMGSLGTIGKGGGTGRGYGSGLGAGNQGMTRSTGRKAGIEDNGSLMAARGSLEDKTEGSSDDAHNENAFISAEEWSLFSFYPSTSIQSWDHAVKLINSNRIPDPESVEINELLNFPQYWLADSLKALFIHTETAMAPWEEGNVLLFISLYNGDTTAIDDPEWEIQFNTDVVAEYRLLGQENYLLAMEDTSAFTMESGSSSQSLFQLKLIADSTMEVEIGQLRLRYTQNGNTKEITRSIRKVNADPSPAMYMAMGIAEYGLVLKNSAYGGRTDLNRAIKHILRYNGSSSEKSKVMRLIIQTKTLLSAENQK